MNLNQVTLPVKDLQRSIAFYQTLGLQLIVHAPPRYARFECPEGDSTFSIHIVEEMPKESQIIIYFEVGNLDETVRTLLDHNIHFDELPEDKTWLWREA